MAEASSFGLKQYPEGIPNCLPGPDRCVQTVRAKSDFAVTIIFRNILCTCPWMPDQVWHDNSLKTAEIVKHPAGIGSVDWGLLQIRPLVVQVRSNKRCTSERDGLQKRGSASSPMGLRCGLQIHISIPISYTHRAAHAAAMLQAIHPPPAWGKLTKNINPVNPV